MQTCLQDSDEWKSPVLNAIRERKIAWVSNTSVFYDLGENLIAKIPNNYSLKFHALHEFILMCRLASLDDSRLVIPDLITAVHLGTNHELHELGLPSNTYGSKLEPSEFYIQAIVMKKFNGTDLANIGPDRRSHYECSLLGLVDALVDHKVRKRDLKPEEIFCLNNSNSVGICDFNYARTGDASDLRDFYLGVVRT